MNVLLKTVLFFLISFNLCLPALGQGGSEELKKKVDAVIARAYKEASVKFPCKLKTVGKAKMGNWKDVENCVNPAHDLVDWESHAAALKKIQEEEKVSSEGMSAAIEAALTAQALSFDKVFLVKKNEEMAALLPLSNSLLKFLPEKSLAELMVHNKNGDLLGTFIGPYSFERSGGLEILSEYRIVNFQYTDLRGNAQAPGERFLLDSFGVPWRDAWSQPGFRLPSNRLINWR